MGKLVRALETVARRVAGETIPLREQALDCFDLHVDYIPESQFVQAHALYDEALPGAGDVFGSANLAGAPHPPERQAAPDRDLIKRALHESRRRTNAMIALPSDAEVTIEDLQDQPFRALAVYLGNNRSEILINQTVPFKCLTLPF